MVCVIGVCVWWVVGAFYSGMGGCGWCGVLVCGVVSGGWLCVWCVVCVVVLWCVLVCYIYVDDDVWCSV